MLNFNWNGCCFAIGFAIGCAILLASSGLSIAQRPYERGHFLLRSDMAPGVAAQTKRLANPDLSFHTQPVRLIVPREAKIEIGGQGTFTPTNAAGVTVGMAIGPVYQFKVTNIPQAIGKELFPSVEILEKLNPPNGLQSQFPVEVVLTQDDLEQALEGRMVTKVIYLENPRTALPQRHREGHQPFFDVGGGEDPLRAANRLGRPMAILRIGSRVPLNTADDTGFDFYSPAPMIMSDIVPNDPRHDWNAVDQQVDQLQPLRIPNRELPRPGQILPSPQPKAHLPPVVPGELNRTYPGDNQ